ncbi:PD-(D/E)XK nuclease superfamily protein [Tenacibaculum sp. MAR_2010_89]|uniref:PD-(D/E)XK nuclease family protein n=1 Tax=Tenacibaculum sp. MAR_2010_89 TaxID=1250198 RepID=UPI0008990E5C|nr:PD-(D/E)XK nuclease family protein [Tenacibaculum sp. MAR_2010_89]SEE04825.1 PD-(D/E)XK nuclease superfamily protein [Tenacibaculum sp. MAR_2010_89]
MQSFISDTLDSILKTTKSFEDVEFILPSQRAGVFVKQTLKDKITTGFLPKISNIGDYIEDVSGMKKADSVQLLFYFYSIYKKEEVNPDTFDVFSSWAFTVLQDFNEIDQHLINAQEIFVYLRDIHRLRKWSVSGTFQETELMKDHFAFMEKLHKLYTIFYEFLISEKKGYQGVIYRESVKLIDDYILKNKKKKFFFIGFNALNAAEELLFQKMLEAKNTEVYWDIDQAFYESNHQAGSFIRKYKTRWKYYQKNPIQTVATHFSSPKNIQVIGASKNITQIKYAGELLSKFSNHNNTALVLADESLLPITLNSLPENVDAINITMGYPLKDVPTTSLLLIIFQLFINQEKLQKKDHHLFYYKDVIALLKHPAIYQLLYIEEHNIADSISEVIVASNTTFVNQEKITEFFTQIPIETQNVILPLFNPFTTVDDFLSRILNVIIVLKEVANELEKEYLYRFFTAFIQLQNLHDTFNYIQDLKTLQQFFKQLIQSESLSFQGEPLQGLQLMGVLETRVLDFENVIITSVNEGVLPGNNQQNSFIPFDVKIEFGLPTYKEKDALFSYHFFRVLQRAKNIYILYNTEHDVFGSGEKSRFVTQLEMMRGDLKEEIISPKIITTVTQQKEITKNEEVLEKLRELAKKGISPSALTNYLYNPIAFYKQKILKIKEFDDVEETVAANTMGTVVHDTLEALYKPFEGKFISVEIITKMQQKTKELIVFYFSEHFKNGDISTGKNRLIFEVANRFVINFLKQEKELLKDDSNQLKIIATEQTLATQITIEGFDFPIKIHGQVDRIDELNGVTRIIDYKTGKVDALNLKVLDFSLLPELKYHKAIQVMLYTFLYTQHTNYDFSKPLEAGIISFKNLKNGFLKMNFSSNYKTPDNEITEGKLEEFMHEIKEILKDLYNPETSFIEPTDLKY